MPSQTNEAALEACIERALTGGVTVTAKEAVLQEPTPDYGGNGWKRGKPGDFNAEFAVDEVMLWQFLESTQAKIKRSFRRLRFFLSRTLHFMKSCQ